MLRGIVTRGLLLGVLAAPLGAVASATSAAALTCAPGDIVVVKEKATPTTVPSGSDVSVVSTALNCTAATQTVTVVSKEFAPDPCGNGSSTDSLTFAPHQFIKKTFTFSPSRCAGRWRFTLVLSQGSTRLSKSWADFTAL
jgi:hypothetical protein